MKLSFKISSTLLLYELLDYLSSAVDPCVRDKKTHDYPWIWRSKNSLWTVTYNMLPNGVCGSDEFVELDITSANQSIWSFIVLKCGVDIKGHLVL